MLLLHLVSTELFFKTIKIETLLFILLHSDCDCGATDSRYYQKLNKQVYLSSRSVLNLFFFGKTLVRVIRQVLGNWLNQVTKNLAVPARILRNFFSTKSQIPLCKFGEKS